MHTRKNPIVWVIKEQAVRTQMGTAPMDYTPAIKFGDLEFVTEFDLPVHGKGTMMEAWAKAARTFCDQYDDARDFIVTTGQPLAIFMLGYLLGQHHKRPRILVWRPQEGKYTPFEFAGLVPMEVAA